MAKTKRPIGINVLKAAQERIAYTFDNFERIFVSFSGGKDSSVMFHLVMDEAIKRKRIVGVMLIDLEGQYTATIEHAKVMFETYKDNIELYWICLPMSLRNAVSTFQPRWICWDEDKKDIWVRDMPKHKSVVSDLKAFPFFEKGMEFEEFVILFGEWYGQGKDCAAFVGIRADESLNRFRTICTFKKETHNGKRFTTKISDNLYNVYPIYDWRTKDIWVYHAKHPDKDHNKVYDLMHQAGVPMSQQRLCQPFGDDQRKGLWLYHILEAKTWYKLIARVNGANGGSLYINETGNINGYNKISKPEGHTWKSFCGLLLKTMPKITREHYLERFKSFVKGWRERGYHDGLPDEAPKVLEDAHWAPSYRRLCKVLLRNDWWCKGLGLTQPKSEAYGKYLEMKKKKKQPLEEAAND
jgi:predicted phosphoadenosine phosphosulfate sulfurtransferase